jgi:plastocyanin domain-containing protein
MDVKGKIMLKHFMPALLGGAFVLAGCNAPAPGPAPSEPAQNAASPVITSPPKTVKNSAAPPAEIPANAQKVTIELPAGYKKNAITVKAGTPVALTFKLTKDADCGNVIALPAAKWEKSLKVGESATVVYTPQKTSDLKFACSMDMMKGSITVQ